MSLHKSLLAGDNLRKHRNVLSRRERMEKLKLQGKWEDGQSVYNLPKVSNRPEIKKKKKKEAKEES